MNVLLKISLVSILVWGFIFTLQVTPLMAHALDMSQTEIYLPEQPGLEGEQILEFVTYLSWVQAASLVSEEKIVEPSVSRFRFYIENHKTYIGVHLKIVNDGVPCTLEELTFPDQEDEQIITGRGLRLDGFYLCKGPIGLVQIKNDMFMDNFPLQNNIVNIYQGNSENIMKGSLLTNQSQEMSINVNDPTSPDVAATPIQGGSSGRLDALTKSFVEKGRQSLPLAIGLAFVLGLLHTLEAGHSKTVLAALVADKRVSLIQGLMYAGVFTATHVADILAMGVLLWAANSWIDVFTALPYLQIASTYTLLLVAFYMVMRNLGHLVQLWLVRRGVVKIPPHGHDHDHPHGVVPKDARDFKQQLLVGFVSGLAPCLFGWSVFMLVLSTRQLWAVIPVVVAFGLGIGVALCLVVWIMFRLRTSVFDRQAWIGEVSPLVSALVLLGFAVYQVS